MLLVFGAAFELPLLVSMLNLIGVLSAARLIRWQRMAIFLIFVFAAVATPSQDPISMCMLAMPMSLLFEMRGALRLAARPAQGPAGGRGVGFGDLSDDEASPLDLTVDPIEERDPGSTRRRPPLTGRARSASRGPHAGTEIEYGEADRGGSRAPGQPEGRARRAPATAPRSRSGARRRRLDVLHAAPGSPAGSESSSPRAVPRGIEQ